MTNEAADNDIAAMATSILIGIWGAESSYGADPQAWKTGRHSAGPLQVTRICCDDYNLRHPKQKPLVWPQDFLGPQAYENSLAVYMDHSEHYVKTGRPRKGISLEKQIALVFHYGYRACTVSGWADPDMYWAKVQARNVPGKQYKDNRKP